MPDFKNKENEAVTLPDGRTVWLSRSLAVVVNVWFIDQNMIPYVLISKRGNGTPDEQGKWVLPCGYLDYNETLAEAAIREVYEETGLDIEYIASDNNDNYSVILENIYSNDGQPYMVNSNPNGDVKQNVTCYFGFVFTGDNFPELTNVNCNIDEVSDLRWVPVDELYKYDTGFGHSKRIDSFYKQYICEL